MKQTAFRQEGGKQSPSSTVRKAFAALALPVLMSGYFGCATTQEIRKEPTGVAQIEYMSTNTKQPRDKKEIDEEGSLREIARELPCKIEVEQDMEIGALTIGYSATAVLKLHRIFWEECSRK